MAWGYYIPTSPGAGSNGGAVPGSYRSPAALPGAPGDLRCPSCQLLKTPGEYGRLLYGSLVGIGEDTLCDDCHAELLALTERLNR